MVYETRWGTRAVGVCQSARSCPCAQTHNSAQTHSPSGYHRLGILARRCPLRIVQSVHRVFALPISATVIRPPLLPSIHPSPSAGSQITLGASNGSVAHHPCIRTRTLCSP